MRSSRWRECTEAGREERICDTHVVNDLAPPRGGIQNIGVHERETLLIKVLYMNIFEFDLYKLLPKIHG